MNAPVFVGASVATVLGGCGLLGWLTPWRRLSSLIAESIPMAPTTAVTLLVLGGTLMLASSRPAGARSRTPVTTVAWVVTSFAAAQILTFFAALPPTLDALLVPFPDSFGKVPMGRMSPLTALGLLLAGLSLLAISLARGRRFVAAGAAILAIAVALLGGGVALGYLFGAPLLYGGDVVPMALPTALALGCLGLSLLGLTPRGTWPLRPFTGPTPRSKLLRAFLPVVPVVLVVEGLCDQVEGLSPALDAALTALASAFAVGAVVYFAARGASQDLERTQAERERSMRELADSEARFRKIFHSNLLPIGMTEVSSGEIIDVNDRFAEFFGFTRDEMIGRTVVELGLWADLEDRSRFIAGQPTGNYVSSAEGSYRRKSGEIRQALLSTEAMTLVGRDKPLNISVLLDMTERKELEAQLRQAQKMEAVGRLAGGVAHDFNNLLGVIVGYTELLLLRADDAQRGKLDQVLKAAHRASDLTRQLLAFSRHQIVDPKVVDLNALVSDLEVMLGRLIGEDVELTIVRGAALGAVRVDQGQLAQVVMNLCVNSRDAMPGGGQLRIETSNVHLDANPGARHGPVAAGSYVRLSVIDSGKGIEPRLLDNIFEPFFTTKDPGKGTGLGLAMVYGIVKQAGGHVWVHSEPGRGATFHIDLPRVEAPVVASPIADASLAPSGAETVLLVEDEDSLRALAVEVLERQGYRVIEAASGASALEIARLETDPIHLLVTDVVMPGMNGRLLAEALVASRPETRVLYMSGYTADVIAERGVLDSGTLLLEKPFTVAALLQRVRQALDAASGECRLPAPSRRA